MIREEIEKLLRDTLKELKFEADKVSLEHPENPEYGDYATSVAFVLAKQEKKNPQEIAEDIVSKLKIENSKFLEHAEARSGFVNFFVTKEYLLKELSEIAEKDDYGKKSSTQRKENNG